MATLVDSMTALNKVEAGKRDELRLKKPRVYEKIRQYDENAHRGVISPILRLAWSYLCNFECDHCCAEHRLKRPYSASGSQIARRSRTNPSTEPSPAIESIS